MKNQKQITSLSIAIKKYLMPLIVLCTAVAAVTDAPADVVDRIAQCESRGLQFDSRGHVLENSSGHIGVLQWDRHIHYQAALELGFDLNTTEGNLGYARKYFIPKYGTSAWNQSRWCWDPSVIPHSGRRHRH